MNKHFDITVEELKELLESGDKINLIDVRSPEEFEADNIGGQLMPLGKLPLQLYKIEDLKSEEIYLFCRSGNRSGMAKNILIAHGFEKVHNVLGGILAYRKLKEKQES